jgi:hypothetical protein
MKTRAFVLPLWLLLLGCPGDDASDTAAGSSTGMAATSTGMAVDSTTGAAPVDCSEITDQAACAAAELEPGLGACGWRSTSLVNPAQCLVMAGPGACFSATNLDGCSSQVPDSCGDGQAYFWRDLGDGTIEMFEDSSMCLASDNFSPCEPGQPETDAPGMACACRCP